MGDASARAFSRELTRIKRAGKATPFVLGIVKEVQAIPRKMIARSGFHSTGLSVRATPSQSAVGKGLFTAANGILARRGLR